MKNYFSTNEQNGGSNQCSKLLILIFCTILQIIYHKSALATHTPPALETSKLSVLMKHARPTKPESYLCTSVLVNPKKDHFVVGFTPNASMAVVHHMFLIGCGRPGSTAKIWDCGSMGGPADDLEQAESCVESSQIIYAWARNAPPLNLPEGVAFRLGKNTRSKYVVLQIHYADVSAFVDDDSKTDTSGAIIQFTETPQPKSAGVYLLGTGGSIRPMSTVHMETACRFDEDQVIHPFAFRTHTHSLGRVVAGYRVRRGLATEPTQWTLIGKKNPMLPQMFYPVTNDENVDLTVTKGDILAARCTMVSNRTTTTFIGGTNADEMCNFYIMYWIEGNQSLTSSSCFTSGPPTYYWSIDGKLQLDNIPDIDASTV